MVLSNQLLHFHSTPTHLLPVYKSDQRSLQGWIFLAHAARVRHSFLFARPKWRVFSQLQTKRVGSVDKAYHGAGKPLGTSLIAESMHPRGHPRRGNQRKSAVSKWMCSNRQSVRQL